MIILKEDDNTNEKAVQKRVDALAHKYGHDYSSYEKALKSEFPGFKRKTINGDFMQEIGQAHRDYDHKGFVVVEDPNYKDTKMGETIILIIPKKVNPHHQQDSIQRESSDPTGVYNALVDGFDVEKEVAEKYADKILKAKGDKNKIKNILSDIIDDKKLNKALNMVMDEVKTESIQRESNEGAIEAYGTKGMSNTKWRKTFKSQAEFEKWLDKNKDDVEVQGTRKAEARLGEASSNVNKDFPTQIFSTKIDRDGTVNIRLKTKDEDDPSFYSYTPDEDEREDFSFGSHHGGEAWLKNILEYPPKELNKFTVYEVRTEDETIADSEHFYYYLSKDRALSAAKQWSHARDPNEYRSEVRQIPLDAKKADQLNYNSKDIIWQYPEDKKMIIIESSDPLKFKISLNGELFRDGESGETVFERPDVHGMDMSSEDEDKLLSILSGLESKSKGARATFLGAKSKARYEITRVN